MKYSVLKYLDKSFIALSWTARLFQNAFGKDFSSQVTIVRREITALSRPSSPTGIQLGDALWYSTSHHSNKRVSSHLLTASSRDPHVRHLATLFVFRARNCRNSIAVWRRRRHVLLALHSTQGRGHLHITSTKGRGPKNGMNRLCLYTVYVKEDGGQES